MKLLLLLGFLGAQDVIPPAQEVIEVRIANFDVVVTDREGKHVRGLTFDDFELLENGKPQEITNLSEYSEEIGPVVGAAEGAKNPPAAEAPPPRQIVIFMDVLTTNNFERKRALTGLNQFVDSLRADDQVMLVSWNRSLKIVVPSTNDRARIKEGLATVQRELSLSRLHGLGVGVLPPLYAGAPSPPAHHVGLSVRAEVRETFNAAKAAVARMSSLPGRKAMLLFTRGFGLPPVGTEGSAEQLELIQELTRLANAGGVPLYGLDATGLDSFMSASASGAGVHNENMAVAMAGAAGRIADGLRYLAGKTGGRAITNSNYFIAGLESVRRDLGSYYSLGYRVHARRVNAERNVTIRTKNPAYIVRTRSSFVERTYDQEIAYGVLANLFFPGTSNDLKIGAAVSAANRKKRNRYEVGVDIRIPYSSLVFVPQPDGQYAEISLFIGSADHKGGASSILRFEHRVKLTTTAPAYTYTFDVDLRTIPGDHRIAVAVFDKTSKVTGYATLDLPKLK